ncbi:hypothetical protein SALWKB29_1202 [Snodgrassella communis]|uniref:Uncharacterized protein n=1 Tax=Snodgrassella communis TaxID=2946699 RepID=A0A836MR79_9NEIS|nr:hypothetical protein SALWKB29_1202 [Snodgrassella communis]
MNVTFNAFGIKCFVFTPDYFLLIFWYLGWPYSFYVWFVRVDILIYLIILFIFAGRLKL